MVRGHSNSPLNFETLAAAGSVQADAAKVGAKSSPALVVVTGGNGVAGIVLPPAGTISSKLFVVINTATGGFNGLFVYPSGTNVINGGVASAPLQLAAGSSAIFASTKSGGWYTVPTLPS